MQYGYPFPNMFDGAMGGSEFSPLGSAGSPILETVPSSYPFQHLHKMKDELVTTIADTEILLEG